MAISDLGAHALFSAVRRDTKAFGLSETRYLHEMRGAFVASKKGLIPGAGLKLIHSTSDLNLPQDTADFFENLRNPREEYWKM